MIKKCIGCGVSIQYEDANKCGFSPKENARYCERCFKIKHYNSAMIAAVPKEINEILTIIEKTNNHVIFVIDFLNINNETISLFKKIKNPKLLVISKSDLISKNLKIEKIKKRINKYYKINSKILFVSSLKKINLKDLINYLLNNNFFKNFVVGFINSGKSSLINALYELYQNEKSIITTSLVPNTTLDFIKMKIQDNLILFDSPGFVMENSLLNNLELIKKVNPKKYIKTITHQIKSNSGIIIEKNIKIFNDSKNKNSWTFYMSNLLSLDKIFEFNDINYINIRINANSDLIIKGFGFITIKEECEIKISNLDEKLIEVRQSIL